LSFCPARKTLILQDMKKDFYTVTECVRIIMAGHRFSCKFVTYDRVRKKGGKVRAFSEAVWERQGDDPDPKSDAIPAEPATTSDHTTRAPRHRKWRTMNVRLLVDGHPTGQVRKIHPNLLIEFNGKPVLP